MLATGERSAHLPTGRDKKGDGRAVLVQRALSFPAGNYCLLAVLVAFALSSSNSAAAEDAPGSLVDVISSHDQARLRQLLVGAQPYTSVATAFQIVSGLGALGFQDGDKIVSSLV